MTEGIVITHPEKVMFPEAGITKGDVAAYYEHVAPVMLPCRLTSCGSSSNSWVWFFAIRSGCGMVLGLF